MKKANIYSGLWLFLISLIGCCIFAYLGYSYAAGNEYRTVWGYRFGTAIWAIVSAYLLLMFMPLPMEQHWTDKVSIGAVLTFGAVVLGIFCWPLVAPATDKLPVVFYSSTISVFNALAVLAAAFVTGAAAYFIGAPNGKHTALAAVPMGVGVWALRSGSLSKLLTYNTDIGQYREIYMSLRWEGLFWLLVVAFGYFGVKASCKICGEEKLTRIDKKMPFAADLVLPVVVTCAIAWILVNFLAQSPKIPTQQFGVIYAQPAQAQIAFALLCGFGVAGYAVKRFMNVGFEVPVIATVVFCFAAAIFAGNESIQSPAMNMPAAIFAKPICSILPIQTVSFGSLGILIGYSIAILGNHKKLLAETSPQ